jgi:hypothetical protein
VANEFNSNEIVRKPSPNIIVFGSWVDKILYKIVPRLYNFPGVATVFDSHHINTLHNTAVHNT